MLSVLAAIVSIHAATPLSSLTLAIKGVRDSIGRVRVDVCTSDEFLGPRCIASGAAPASKGVTVVVLRDVPVGVYAVQAYHDRNDNHRVDRNGLGMPTEEFGFSRSPPLGLHGPAFTRAAFTYAGDAEVVNIQLRGLW